jgi:hypothetical protein
VQHGKPIKTSTTLNDVKMDLEQIDILFSDQLTELRKIIEEFSFTTRFEFRLEQNTDYNDLINTLNYSAIYLIEMKTNNNQTFQDWFSNFQPLWEAPIYKDKFVPNTKKKRVKKNIDLLPWIPLYIGKSKNISQRIKEHIELKLDRPTNAMKLRERTNIYRQVYRVSTIEINVNNYDLIMPQFENILRDRINPILGRK